MKPEIKERWVAALRSGEYLPARGFLRRDNCFCGLGVLCDLAAQDGVVQWSGPVHGIYSIGCATQSLPSQVVEWSGVPDCSPTVSRSGKKPLLTELNDSGVSFSELADLIEAQL